ncbi:HET-domain-containing protein [Lentithecium fluviatile CBS 122367]|uniref:HET-domain-containing protein n=1 Tax=Lentithecium fluviatile CBS 122367 TaxID=1168545 RepID=A0A6G1IFN9_9PLEO|nr:HET-domain-containing protein [Lentithecium fluviatile CBS 122367]
MRIHYWHEPHHFQVEFFPGVEGVGRLLLLPSDGSAPSTSAVSISASSSKPQTTANLTFVKKCLRLCRESHSWTCQPQSDLSLIQPLRVIDCKTRELCLVTSESPYAALSYVWGADAYSEQPLEGKLPSSLPRTIQDAIDVALLLDISFLWIDRYCINQRDSDEKHRFINNMDKIYAGAVLHHNCFGR